MSQATPTIGSGETGTSYRGLDNSGKSAANTAHKGASPPSYAEAGYTWIDDSADPLWYERKFKGGTVSDLANWPIIAEIDSSAAVTRPRIRRRILSKTAAYTATVADQGAFVLADPTSAAFTIKLPAASAALAGFAIGFRNDGTGNDLTVQRADATSDTVDGATSVVVAPGETLELVLDASTGWKIASGSGSADNKKVLVSGTDTTEGYLAAKLSGTNGVGVSTINGGSNEQVQIVLNINGLTSESTFADDDQFAKQKASAGNRRKFTWANLKTALAEQVKVFQTVNAILDTVVTVSSSHTIPDDDTKPQSGEGDEIITVTITPTNSGNNIEIEAQINVAMSTAGFYALTLFRDSGADALKTVVGSDSGTGAVARDAKMLTHSVAAGSTSATTFKIRAGSLSSAPGTLTINGLAGARKFGGTLISSIRVREVAPT